MSRDAPPPNRLTYDYVDDYPSQLCFSVPYPAEQIPVPFESVDPVSTIPQGYVPTPAELSMQMPLPKPEA
ncbi:hypothetical protein KIPB_003997, partial [Kipferlia bialata]|eukprot:g3997.t1